MEAALVSVSMGVMKPLLSKLTKLLEGEYIKVKGVRKQIKFLTDELSAMSATLQMLADAEQLNPQMREWRDRLRELAYDLEDCVDAFMIRVDDEHDGGSGSSFKRFFRKLRKLKACHEIANQIEELKACVIDASERHKRYAFVQSTQDSSISSIDPRLPALYVDIEKLVGMDGPKKHIIEQLTMEMKGSSTEVKVVSIYGCGGLGKTTLANQVYHAIKRHFLCAAFVSVSGNPNMTKILRDIAEEVGSISKPDDDVEKLINGLRKHLRDKRYLIVIDDIWDAKAWEIIQLALWNNNSGSRIITTTRSAKVASCCSSQGGYVHQMEALSFADSKRLFCRRAFGSEELCFPHLEKVCHGILEKCSGLPLALITISSLLVDQVEKDEWKRVLTAIGRALAKNPEAEDMTKILSLSYYDLPRQLRTCFLYLSIFPEDYVIAKERLVNRWIAEGFIHEEQELSAYRIGENYFNDLINRSMIQPIDVEYGQAKACRVHDIILDYIKCKAADENFVTSIDYGEHRYTLEYKIRRLCVITKRNEEKDSIWTSLILSHVRSLSIFGHAIQSSLLSFKALRVLDVEASWGLNDHYITTFIEKLPHLKYLRLCSYLIHNLPEEIGELHYLETLDIQGTRIKQLPSTVAKLQRLAHLYVDPSIRFPDGMIGKIKSLEELAEFEVCSYEIAKSMQEFSQLTKLRTLVISWKLYCSFDSRGRQQAEDLQILVGTLISKCSLQNLYIIDHQDNFPWYQPLSMGSWCPTARCRLQKLHITFCFIDKVQNWMSSLVNLRELELQIYRTGPEDLEILAAIPSLLYLELVTFCSTNGRIIFRGNKGFRNLQYISLHIVSCGTALEFEAGSVPKVQHLKLKYCVHKMEGLNDASNFGIQNLSSLAKVEVVIRGNRPSNIDNDDIVESVPNAIKAAIETLPNRPSASFITESNDDYCKHSKIYLERVNQNFGVPEWLEKCQVEGEYTEHDTASEGEKEDCNMSLLRVLDEINELEEEEDEEDCWN